MRGWIALLGLWSGLALAEEERAGVDPAEDPDPEVGDAGPDRSGPPDVLPSPLLDLDEPEIHALGPGIEAWYVPVDGVRRVNVYAVVHRGMHDLAGWPTVPAQAMGQAMDVATTRYPADALSTRADLFEVELYSWLGHHSGGVSLSVPAESLGEGVELLGEVLRAPVFPRKDLKRHLRDERVRLTLTGPSSPRAVAHAVTTYAWFPPDHPYGARPDLSALQRISRKEVVDLHAQWLRSGPITLVVTGPVPWEGLSPHLEAVVDGLGAPGEPSESLPVAPPTDSRVLAVDLAGQEQVTLTLRLPAPVQEDDDRVAFELLRYALGGHFLSRLNANLREDKGYTYGARATYHPGRTSGHLTVQVDVAAENLAATVGEIEHEIARLVTEGVTAEELEWAVRARAFAWNETRRTADSTRAFYGQRLLAGERLAQAREREATARALGPEAVAEVAGRWLAADAPRQWVIAGDRGQLSEQLGALGWETQWLDPLAGYQGAFR